MKKFRWLHSARLLDTSQVLKVPMFNSNVEFTNIFSLVMHFIGFMGYQPSPQSQDLKHLQGFFSATRHWMDRHVISWRKKTGVGKCGERMRKVVRANIRVLQTTTKHIYVLLLWARIWAPSTLRFIKVRWNNAAMFFVWVPAKTWAWSDINRWAHREKIIINIEELSVQQPNCEKIRREFLAMKIQFWKSLPHGQMEKVSSDTKEMPNCFQNAVSLLRADYSSPRCS